MKQKSSYVRFFYGNMLCAFCYKVRYIICFFKIMIDVVVPEVAKFFEDVSNNLISFLLWFGYFLKCFYNTDFVFFNRNVV